MPQQTKPLAAFIVARLAEVVTPLELFAACDDAGFDLAELVDVLADPYDHLPEDPAWMLEGVMEGWLGTSPTTWSRGETAWWLPILRVERLQRAVLAAEWDASRVDLVLSGEPAALLGESHD